MSAHSTISLCGDGEVASDGMSFYDMMLFGHANFKCEQNNAGDPANLPRY
jgi:hypothetical protein